MAAIAAAKSLARHRGTLSAGAWADIVALTMNLDVFTIWMAGISSVVEPPRTG
jgi:N-acetylglucosamine-6-phosphate deacetylase